MIRASSSKGLATKKEAEAWFPGPRTAANIVPLVADAIGAQTELTRGLISLHDTGVSRPQPANPPKGLPEEIAH